MQDPAIVSPNSSPFSSPAPTSDLPELKGIAEQEKSSASSAPAKAEPAASNLDQSLAALRDTLDEHKGKLAIGAAAMLGLMVYYKWGEKSLAKEDPQEYERLRRIKNRVRHADHDEQPAENTEASYAGPSKT